MQIATAIANLFNDDDEKQKEIENLQRRIDQLQWELDNADAVRLQNNVGDAVKKLRDIYAETTQEVLRLHLTSQQYGNAWTRMFARMRYDSEVYEKSVEKIADAYAKVAYTADKALGGKKYDESRKQLENLAEQQILIQKQINEEQSKKKPTMARSRSGSDRFRRSPKRWLPSSTRCWKTSSATPPPTLPRNSEMLSSKRPSRERMRWRHGAKGQ